MWDGKPYEHIIWRIMKPKFEKPFKKEEWETYQYLPEDQ
jgi:hypothetical protein